MIELLQDLPDDVLGLRAHGKVTDRDYEDVVVPAVEARAATGGRLRLLYVLGDDFDGFEAEAMWDDAKVGVEHWGAWERVAMVTDSHLYRALVKAWGFMMPGTVRVFPLDELDEAVEWISNSD